eukprot:s6206_g5.t1
MLHCLCGCPAAVRGDTRCGPRSALWRLGTPGSKPRQVRCLLGFVDVDGHSSGHAAGRMPSLLAAMQAAAFLRSEDVHVASWEEAIPGQADMRPRTLDEYGEHRAACATSGVLAARAVPVERAIARVCQEAGARVGRNVALSAMNLDVPIHDAWRIEVVCNGLPLWHGAQLAVCYACQPPFSGRQAAPRPSQALLCAQLPGASAGKLTPSLTAAGGAAWSCLGLRLVAAGTAKPPPSSASLLARARATPAALRPAAQAAWVLRWSGLVAVAVQRALTTTFLELPMHAKPCAAGPAPDLHKLLADARGRHGPRTEASKKFDKGALLGFAREYKSSAGIAAGSPAGGTSGGVLRARGKPLERAAARICREAGATVAFNVRLRDLNVDVARQDERRIEVIANGLALWGGSQLAVAVVVAVAVTIAVATAVAVAAVAAVVVSVAVAVGTTLMVKTLAA